MAVGTKGNAGIPSGGVKGIPWSSIIGLFVMLGIGVTVFLLTSATLVTAWLRWGVTIAWLVYTGILGFHDFVLAPNATGNQDAAPGRDTVPFDLWTISHTGAGLVFGVWFMPLVYVLGLTILWEFYEYFFVGLGDKENLLNRSVDIGVALVGWLLVVLIVMAATGASFPFITPYRP